MLRRLHTASLIWPTAAMLPMLALLIGLGSWQWSRRAWKEGLIATIEARSRKAPLPHEDAVRLACLPTTERNSLERSCDYQPVRLAGTFEHEGERHIFISVPMQASGIGGPGFWVFTPFRLEGGDGAVYVNRGFVPEARKNASSRAAGQTAGRTEIAAWIRSAERRGLFSGANDPARNIYFVRDPSELGPLHPTAHAHAGAATTPEPFVRSDRFYVEQLGGPPAGGLPLPLAGEIRLPNRHLEYALTWWALAAALTGVYAAFAAGRLRGR